MSRYLSVLFFLLMLPLWCAGLEFGQPAQSLNPKVPPPDPILGTWKLNTAKSKFSPVLLALIKSAAPKEQTEVYRLVNDRIELTATVILSDGSRETFNINWPAQGGKVPDIGDGLSYIETRMAPGEWLVTTMQEDGKQLTTRHKIVSKDRKTMRHVVKGFDPQGMLVEQLEVFDKQ